MSPRIDHWLTGEWVDGRMDGRTDSWMNIPYTLSYVCVLPPAIRVA